MSNSVTVVIDIDHMSDPRVSKALTELYAAISASKKEVKVEEEVHKPEVEYTEPVPQPLPQVGNMLGMIGPLLGTLMAMNQPLSQPINIPKPVVTEQQSVAEAFLKNFNERLSNESKECTSVCVVDDKFAQGLPPHIVQMIKSLLQLMSAGIPVNGILEGTKALIKPFIANLPPGGLSESIKASIDNDSVLSQSESHRMCFLLGFDIDEQDNAKLLDSIINTAARIGVDQSR